MKIPATFFPKGETRAKLRALAALRLPYTSNKAGDIFVPDEHAPAVSAWVDRHPEAAESRKDLFLRPSRGRRQSASRNSRNTRESYKQSLADGWGLLAGPFGPLP